jgi:hypothetical protein
MLYYDGDEAQISAGELQHNVGQQRQQGDKNKNDPSFNNTQRPEDMGLTGARSLNLRKVIGARWM